MITGLFLVFQVVLGGVQGVCGGAKVVHGSGGFERNLIRERTKAGLDAARARGKVGGRPRSLIDADLIAAKALLGSEDLSVVEVAKRVGVSPATLYRYATP